MTAGVVARARASFWGSGYWLVLVLIAVSYALCATQFTSNPSSIALLVQLVTVAVTLRVASDNVRLRHVGWTVLGIAASAVVIVELAEAQGQLLDILLSAASMLAYLLAPAVIITQQARRDRVDGQTLLAAIAAYVMVGMFFTFVYNLISLLFSTPTFGEQQVDSLTSQLFFSFTTLTTTGYGNVVPESASVQSVAIAEAITGQLFLVIAVGKVVSGWLPARKETDQQ